MINAFGTTNRFHKDPKKDKLIALYVFTDFSEYKRTFSEEEQELFMKWYEGKKLFYEFLDKEFADENFKKEIIQFIEGRIR